MILPIFIVCFLIFVNAIFAMGEIALISSKRLRLADMAKKKVRGAARALQLADEPQSFLPTVQVGMTVVSILEGAYGGSEIEARLARKIALFSSLKPYANDVSIVIVVLMITIGMLIFGELVPKQLALYHPERYAAALSGVLFTASKIMRPIVKTLNAVSTFILRSLSARDAGRASLTEEELRAVLLEGARAGVLEAEERVMIERLLRLADRPVRAIMTPRSELFWVDRHSSRETLTIKLRDSAYTRIVVCDGTVDHPIGIVLAKDLMARMLQGLPLSIEATLKTPVVVPDSMSAQDMIESMRHNSAGIAFVLDEYGSFEGVVTPSDIFEAIVGDEHIEQNKSKNEKAALSGEYTLDGFMPADEVQTLLDLPSLPAQGSYHTLGGLILTLLRRVPSKGDKIVFGRWMFEVTEMDKRRVIGVRASRQILAEN